MLDTDYFPALWGQCHTCWISGSLSCQSVSRHGIGCVGESICFLFQSSFNLLGSSQILALKWRHNGRNNISNHQPRDCFLNRLFRRRSKKTSKHRVTGLCAGNSPGTGEFPAQMASNAENASIWWRHHGCDSRCSSSTATRIPAGTCHNNDVIITSKRRRDVVSS